MALKGGAVRTSSGSESKLERSVIGVLDKGSGRLAVRACFALSGEAVADSLGALQRADSGLELGTGVIDPEKSLFGFRSIT